MSRNIDLSGLKNVRDKLQRLKAITDDDIVMAVAEKGKEIAEVGFGSAADVEAIPLGNGKARLEARGQSVSFIEYGIGTSGEGHYPGELPTQPITFYSTKLKREHTTSGWEYNYFAKYVRNQDPNAKVKDVTGFQAKAPMWNTANRLKQGEAKQAVEQLFKERDI